MGEDHRLCPQCQSLCVHCLQQWLVPLPHNPVPIHAVVLTHLPCPRSRLWVRTSGPGFSPAHDRLQDHAPVLRPSESPLSLWRMEILMAGWPDCDQVKAECPALAAVPSPQHSSPWSCCSCCVCSRHWPEAGTQVDGALCILGSPPPKEADRQEWSDVFWATTEVLCGAGPAEGE